MKTTRSSSKTRPLQSSGPPQTSRARETSEVSPPAKAALPGRATSKIGKARATRVKRALLASAKAKRSGLDKTPPNVRRERELWRNVRIPKSRDIRLLMPKSLPKGQRFETLSDAAQTDEANIEVLSNCSLDTAVKIERGDRASSCSLPCRARSARRFRVYHTAELLRIAELFEGPHQIATIYLAVFPAGSLRAAVIKLAHGALPQEIAAVRRSRLARQKWKMGTASSSPRDWRP